MTTSGVSLFSLNRDQILREALLLAGVIDENETPSATMNDLASSSLNAMVKHWQATGIYIWVTAEATLFLHPTQYFYEVGSGLFSHCTESYVQTTMSADASSSATTINVTSSTGISTDDFIGVVISTGIIHWTVVAGVPSATSVTLVSGLAASASSGAFVFAYTTNLDRPLKIVSARRYNLVSQIDTPLMIYGREDYFDLPTKANLGIPNLLFYDRRGGANQTGIIHIWLSESTTQNVIKFTWQRPIQDFVAAADTPDLPQEWLRALKYNLAEELALDYGNEKRLALIEPRAAKYLAEVSWNEKELEDISFYPDLRNMRR